MDDTIQIACTRCQRRFREPARRLTNGYSKQCPGCDRVLFFDEDSSDPNIRKAMLVAKKTRRLLADEVDAGRSAKTQNRFADSRLNSESAGDEGT